MIGRYPDCRFTSWGKKVRGYVAWDTRMGRPIPVRDFVALWARQFGETA